MPAGEKNEKGTLLARLRVAATARRNQGDLLRWYLAHYEDFAAILAAVRRPGWSAIAIELNREGITRPNGQSITADHARQIWFRARRIRGGATKEERPNAPFPASLGTEEPTQSTSSQALALKPLPTVTPDDDDEIALTPFTIRSRKPGES